MEAFGIIAGAGWASGLNLYLVALLLGVTGRLGWADIPTVFTRTDVMIGLGVLVLLEFVVDKVPYLDNVWDAIHTVVRPLGAAAIGAVIAGESSSVGAAVGGVVAGALAFDAHAVKATTRVTVNASPEPVSNAALSVFEDGLVTGLVVLAVTFPVITMVVVGVLVVAATAVTIWLWRVARRAIARLRERRAVP